MPDVLEIPINSDDASFKIRTILEEVELVLRFDWNTREERWALSILNADEEPILSGLPMHINLELIERFEDSRLPPGQILLYDTEGKFLECGRDDLGDRCKLLYQTSV